MCRAPQSSLDQVKLSLPTGQHLMICRIRDSNDTWLALREIYHKLVEGQLPLQTFKNHLKSYSVRTRPASVKETGHLATHGAIKKRAKQVSCLEVSSLALMLETSLGDENLANEVRKIPELPSQQKGPQNALQLAAQGGRSSCLPLPKTYPIIIHFCSIPSHTNCLSVRSIVLQCTA